MPIACASRGLVGREYVDAAARIGRRRQLSRDLQRRRAEQRRIDAVVHERRAQRDAPRVLHAAEATAVKSPASIAAVGTNVTIVGGRLRRAAALIRAKEEQPVAHDRAPEGAAELVAHQAVVEPLAGRGIDAGERVRRVEPVVAENSNRSP